MNLQELPRQYSANDVHFQISNGSTFIRFKTKRWYATPAPRHQSFLEGFAYPSFLPASVLCFQLLHRMISAEPTERSP